MSLASMTMGSTLLAIDHLRHLGAAGCDQTGDIAIDVDVLLCFVAPFFRPAILKPVEPRPSITGHMLPVRRIRWSGRKTVGKGKSVSVRMDLGGSLSIKK